ncbi:MAG: hypothetical protein P8N42_06110 [Hyphomicrobiales bacterium]|nr:hypothetical protein [Hyphomicrobiales bacterium]
MDSFEIIIKELNVVQNILVILFLGISCLFFYRVDDHVFKIDFWIKNDFLKLIFHLIFIAVIAFFTIAFFGYSTIFLIIVSSNF